MVGEDLEKVVADGVLNHPMVHLVFRETLLLTKFSLVQISKAFSLIPCVN